MESREQKETVFLSVVLGALGLIALLIGLHLSPGSASASQGESKGSGSSVNSLATSRLGSQWSLREQPTESPSIEERMSKLENSVARMSKEVRAISRGQSTEIRTRRAAEVESGFVMYHIRYPWEK